MLEIDYLRGSTLGIRKVLIAFIKASVPVAAQAWNTIAGGETPVMGTVGSKILSGNF